MSDLGIIFDNPFLGIIFGEEESSNPLSPPTETIEATPTTVDIGDAEMRVLTCNVQNTPDLPRSKVIATGRAVSGKFGVGGFQELGEKGEDRRDVKTGLGIDYRMTSHGPLDVQTQIAFLKNLSTGQGGYEQAVPGGQPYPNPPRGWVWQEFTNPRGMRFLFVNTHFVNKAWNDVPDPYKQLRRKNWEMHYLKLAAWLRPRVRALPTIVTGDFNRVSFPLFTPNMRLLAGNGIDKIFIGLPQGYRVKGGNEFTIPTPSDHDALGKQLTLTRKEPS